MKRYFPTYLQQYKDRWYQTPASYAHHNKGNQTANSRRLKNLKSQLMQWFIQNPEVEDLSNPASQTSLKKLIIPFMDQVLGVEEWVCHFLDKEQYYETTSEFIARVKKEFPGTPFEDIFQALRNVWVLISLQLYMNVDVVLSDAIFAYSMLYPLTDNYLDDTSISTETKKEFNKKFYKKIKGEEVSIVNPSEASIFRMIDLIHGDYNREAYPEVTESLLAILDGQNQSLLQHKIPTLYDVDLTELSFYKGGTSVLADAYLVKGSLSENEAMFAYGYGVILQIADDLQDLKEDLEGHHYTMVNTQATCHVLDGFMDKYLNFIDSFFEDIYIEGNKKQIALKQLLLSSIDLLLYGGVRDNKSYFSKAYYNLFMKRARFSSQSFTYKNKQLWQLISKRT